MEKKEEEEKQESNLEIYMDDGKENSMPVF